MSKYKLLALIFLVLILVFFFVKGTHTQQEVDTPTSFPSPSNTSLSYCLGSDVAPSLEIDHGAGNVYGTFSIKNISNKDCAIIGYNYIQPNYDNETIKNIVVSKQGAVEKESFMLKPGQIVYAKTHYPNGPQCTQTKNAEVSFTYQISPSTKITFSNPQSGEKQNLTICSSPLETTTIELWNISTQSPT